jgi:hypothetical protein
MRSISGMATRPYKPGDARINRRFTLNDGW